VSDASQGVDVQETVDRLYTEWFAAAKNANDDWYRSNLADEFFYVMANGQQLNLDEIVESAHHSQNSDYRLLDVRGKQYGHIILAVGRFFGKGDFPEDYPTVTAEMRARYAKGQELSFAGTWIERDGELRCLHLQTTPIV
jgi:hypothetical protein